MEVGGCQWKKENVEGRRRDDSGSGRMSVQVGECQ